MKFTYNRPKPDVLESILRSKANPKYNTRRLWYELNMPDCTSDIFDGKMLSESIPDGLLCHTKEMRATRKHAGKKKESKEVNLISIPFSQQIIWKDSFLIKYIYIYISERISYMQMRQERENFRRKLVELIAWDNVDADGSIGDSLHNEFPNKQEKEILRYYYYIKHGIDTIHVSPMSKRVLQRFVNYNIPIILRKDFSFNVIVCLIYRIIKQIPVYLNKWTTALNENIDEIKSDYIFAMKKAVVDFALQNSISNLKKEAKIEMTPERLEIKALTNRWRYR